MLTHSELEFKLKGTNTHPKEFDNIAIMTGKRGVRFFQNLRINDCMDCGITKFLAPPLVEHTFTSLKIYSNILLLEILELGV